MVDGREGVGGRKDWERDLSGHVGLTRCGRIVGGRDGDGISSRGFVVGVGNRCEHAELDDLAQMLWHQQEWCGMRGRGINGQEAILEPNTSCA